MVAKHVERIAGGIAKGMFVLSRYCDGRFGSGHHLIAFFANNYGLRLRLRLFFRVGSFFLTHGVEPASRKGGMLVDPATGTSGV